MPKSGFIFQKNKVLKFTPESKRQHKVRSDHKKLCLQRQVYRSRLALDSVAVSYLKKRGISGSCCEVSHWLCWKFLEQSKEVFGDYEDNSDLFLVGL